jgi:hypothetical protein
VAATLSGRMNRNLVQLLGGHLRAFGGGWLCACLAIQFLVTSAAWALGGQHEFLPGVLLSAIAGMQAAPGRSLAWQVLPISRRELCLANWWAVAALPGFALSVALALAFASNHSEGWPAPSTTSFALQIVGIWSALGYIAWLPLKARTQAGYRGLPLLLLSWGIPLLAAFYGYPLGARVRVISIPIMAAGCVLLLLSFLRARRGHSLTATAAFAIQAPHGAAAARSRALAPAGWRQLVPVVTTQATMMLGLGLGGACLLRLFYPRATEALLWAFLIAVGMWSVIASQRWTRSLWCWRCLPLTTRRLALAVEAVELLPLSLALLAAWAAGRLAPHTALPLPGWLAAATVAVVAVANAQARIARRAHDTSKSRAWLAYSMPLAYLGFLPAAQLAASQLHWLPVLMWVGAGLLLMASFRFTRTQMRSPENIRGLEALRE